MPTCEGTPPRPRPTSEVKNPEASTPPTHPAKAPVIATLMPTDTPHPKPSRTEYMAAYRKRQRADKIHRVSVTLNNLEYIRMNASAIRQDEKFATHLKRRAFADLDTTYIVPIELRERLDEALIVWRGIGNNLNQLARHANEMRAFMHTGEVQLQLRRMEEVLTQLITQPKRAF
jgi:Bacterial mobilisation protein (MobC)